MPNNPYNNKVVLADGTVLIDLTNTTATADDVLTGKYFYTAAGARIQGSLRAMTAAEILAAVQTGWNGTS